MSGPADPDPKTPVPIALLTGFLGAGKTTLLEALLRQPAMARTAVLVNEFGEIGIDHLLVGTVERDMLVLNTGCVCCAARGDLIDSLKGLLAARGAGRIDFDRILIETTGTADPGPILNAVLLDPELSRLASIGPVIAVLDAACGTTVLDRHAEALRQVALADSVVLSKLDLLPLSVDRARAELQSRIKASNPTAPILVAQEIDAVVSAILEPDSGSAREAVQLLPHHHSQHRHSGSLRATCLRAGVVRSGILRDFLRVLIGTEGRSLLRLKGLVATSGEPMRPLLVNVVGEVVHPSRRLPDWPDGDRCTRIVVITEGSEPQSVTDLWDAFFGLPTIDRPDGAALARSLEAGPGLF